MRKFLVFFIMLIIIAALGTAFYLQTHTVFNDDSAIGNSSGNLYNKGYYCEYDGKVYFSNYKDNRSLYVMDSDCSNFKKLHDDRISSINAFGDYIFYTRENYLRNTNSSFILESSNTGLYRINKNGKNLKKLSSSPTGIAALKGNYIYYQNFDKTKGFRLYRVKIDGKNDKHLSNEDIVPAAFSGNTMYYTGIDSEHNINSLNLDTLVPETIYETSAFNCILNQDYIFFISAKDNYGIVRIDIDGKNPSIIVEERCSTFNISTSGKYLYYQIDGGDNNRICRLNLETMEMLTLKEGNYANINITSNYVFFTDIKTNEDYFLPSGDSNEVKLFNPEIK